MDLVDGTDERGTDVPFIELDLRGLDFSYTEFNGVNFSYAKLHNTNFFGAELQNTNFVGAELQETDFTSADLQSATFQPAAATKAKFDGADFSGADFTGDCNFTQSQLRLIVFNHATPPKGLPSGSVPMDRGYELKRGDRYFVVSQERWSEQDIDLWTEEYIQKL